MSEQTIIQQMRDLSALIREGNYGNYRAIARLVAGWADDLAALAASGAGEDASQEERCAKILSEIRTLLPNGHILTFDELPRELRTKLAGVELAPPQARETP